MLEAGILALAITNSIAFGIAGHLTNRLAAYAGLMALAAVAILLAKSNVLFPRRFNEAVRGLFGPPWANNVFDGKNWFAWWLIAMCAYLIAVSLF